MGGWLPGASAYTDANSDHERCTSTFISMNKARVCVCVCVCVCARACVSSAAT